MNSEQQILLDGATSDLVECVVRYEGVSMSDALTWFTSPSYIGRWKTR